MRRIIDLSPVLFNDQRIPPIFRRHVPTKIYPTATHEAQKRAVSAIQSSMHAGTHMEGGYHYLEDGLKLDDLPLDKFIGQATILRAVDKGELGGEVTEKDLEPFANRVKPNMIAIVQTGWTDKAWKNEDKFFGNMWHGINYDDSNVPKLSPSAAKWLIKKRVKTIGCDMGGIGGMETHTSIFRAGIAVIEGLSNLTAVDQDPFFFVGLPLKVENSEAAIGRAVAILE